MKYIFDHFVLAQPKYIFPTVQAYLEWNDIEITPSMEAFLTQSPLTEDDPIVLRSIAVQCDINTTD